MKIGSFREFMQPFFPNDYVDEKIIDAYEGKIKMDFQEIFGQMTKEKDFIFLCIDFVRQTFDKIDSYPDNMGYIRLWSYWLVIAKALNKKDLCDKDARKQLKDLCLKQRELMKSRSYVFRRREGEPQWLSFHIDLMWLPVSNKRRAYRFEGEDHLRRVFKNTDPEKIDRQGVLEKVMYVVKGNERSSFYLTCSLGKWFWSSGKDRAYRFVDKNEALQTGKDAMPTKEMADGVVVVDE